MRRQGNFADSPATGYGAGQIQNAHSDFQGQLEAFTPERDQPSQPDGQWRWERDGPPNMSRPMPTAAYNESQGVDSSRTYYRGQMDPKSGMETQGSGPRAQPQHHENSKPGYENNRGMQTFEGIEQKFMDDITRLAKDQMGAEDAEIARHRERINTINTRYEEQLAALRSRHAGKREEIMRKESQARQQQYKQQTPGMMDQYHTNAVGAANLRPSGHPQGYIGNAQDPADAPPSRSYGSDRFEAYGERARFQGGERDHGFESRGQYPGGTVSRFY
ncbi:hypothetical protein Bca4012_001096 [Brassica carinata]|uniref:Uncharacterized protein n=4 Tax=Brassica TaxID=3705 RepID=A0ABQ8A974_BRANA|nr:PREDICTED: uncharacterized protein LOC106331738 [Brassica oleracea var. oleracea]XP_048608103.1 uncharacterized protein LOC106386959 [Brassica napus]KAG2297409.1 hypothetical protein Bca52824_044078 [Brassica carinata]KAH0888610.1 hypothetical protein HID58_051039 [Brassica napus]VDC87121.1 unnamed protein product [Brassica oleracea]